MRAYGDKIADEAKRALMADSYSDALKQQELKPVIMPEIEELQFGHGKPFQYMATLEVSPAFELPEYNGLEVEKERRSVTEEDVTKALSTLQEQRVEYRDVDRPMGEEDFVWSPTPCAAPIPAPSNPQPCSTSSFSSLRASTWRTSPGT